MKQNHIIVLIALLLLIWMWGHLMSVSAQQEQIETHTVSYDSVSLEYSTDVAQFVDITSYAGDAPETATIGFSTAPSTSFSLYNPPHPLLTDDVATATVTVIRMDDIALYTFMQERVDELREIANPDVDLSSYERLPFLPIYSHGHSLYARARHIEDDNIVGIGYITVIQASAEPFMQDSFFYTVQALSKDGQYYISANLQFTTEDFPESFRPDFDYEAFYDNLETYMVEANAILNSADDSAFTPNLSTLDRIILSMTFPR